MPLVASPPDRHARDPRGQSPDSGPRLGRPLGRLLLGLVILTSLLTVVPVEPAAAASSAGGPTGEYTPKRVWQMNKNCIWAAGEMLLDKWTHGGRRVRQSVLRRASHDKKGGSSLYDLSRGIARVTGIHVPYSPGGDTMAWWQLLDRLDRGGGAVLVGEYGDLPAHFSRWDRSFARRRNSSHAVYVQSYDRVQGRVWLMDPLADGDFRGEWIGVGALHRFATFRDGKVMAAATPARSQPRTAPLTDQAYRLGAPRLNGIPVAGSNVEVQIGLAVTADFPAPAAHRLVARWVPVVLPPIPPAALTAGQAPRAADTARTPDGILPPAAVQVVTASPPERAGHHGFSLSLPVPSVPGAYRLTVGLAEVGQRGSSRSFRPITVEVVGPYAGSVAFPKMPDIVVGQAFTAKLTVANIGTIDWRTPTRTGGPLLSEPVIQTHLVLTWRSAAGVELPGGEVPAEIAPGHSAVLPVALVAPSDGGAWTLLVDIANASHGTVSSTGRDLPTAAVRVSPRAHVAEH